MADYVTCESTKPTLPLGTEEDVRVKVERLSDEEVHEEVSQPVSASQSSLSDQQTVPGSEPVQEDLLISPQSSSIGIMLSVFLSFLWSIQRFQLLFYVLSPIEIIFKVELKHN